MMEIKWDKELENLSQGYLDTCPGMNHNPNRKTPSYSYAGENIWMGSVGYTFDAAKPVDMWYGEVNQIILILLALSIKMQKQTNTTYNPIIIFRCLILKILQ